MPKPTHLDIVNRNYMPIMDDEHCVIAVPSEVAKFSRAADKRRYNVSFNMSCRPSRRLGRTLSPASALVRNDAAKLRLFYNIARKKYCLRKVVSHGGTCFKPPNMAQRMVYIAHIQ